MENLLTLNMLWLLDKVSLDLHDPDVLEAHPGSQGGADQDTEDHHYLLPENRNWLKNDHVFFLSLTCAPFVGIQELFWCRRRPELCTQPRCPRGRRFWDKWSTIGEDPTIKRDDKWRKSLTIDTYWRPPPAAQQAPPCPWTSRGAPWSTSPTSWTSRAWWSGIT